MEQKAEIEISFPAHPLAAFDAFIVAELGEAILKAR
jgi:hypothetical protein